MHIIRYVNSVTLTKDYFTHELKYFSFCVFRLFGTKCTKCSLGFSKNDFVMRAKNKIFHIDCFRCVACSRQLIPGDEFALRDDGLFCRADIDIINTSSNNVSDAVVDTKVTISNNNNNEKSGSGKYCGVL